MDMEMNMDMDMLLLIDIDRDMYTCTYICKHVCMCVCLSPGLRPKRKQVIICDASQLRFTFYTESPELPTRIARNRLDRCAARTHWQRYVTEKERETEKGLVKKYPVNQIC